jgi:hypothetical protein
MDRDLYKTEEARSLQKNAEKIEERVNKRNRADTTTLAMMLSVAIAFDSVQALLLPIIFVGWILSSMLGIYAWLTFYVWTSIKGWGFSDTMKQFLIGAVLPSIEVIPILNTLPTWTLKVVLTYSFLKAEDVIYNATGGRADVEKLAAIYLRYKRLI